MIHCTPQVLTHLVDRGSVIKEGNVWVTPMGHIVVADAGYSGDGPDADAADSTSQWMYGTSLLSVILGPVEIIPGTLEDARISGSSDGPFRERHRRLRSETRRHPVGIPLRVYCRRSQHPHRPHRRCLMTYPTTLIQLANQEARRG